MAEPEYKVLSDLRVTELKAELDKRGLDKNGIKIILADRLETAIRADGHDPATYKFCVGYLSPAKQKSATPTSERVEDVVEPINEETEAEGALEVCTEEDEEEEKPEDVVSPVPVAQSPLQEPKAPATAADEAQLDDPLDDNKTEPVKAAAVETKDTKEDEIARSFWVRGITATTKAADLREKFSAFGAVARAKIFTSKKETGKTFGLVTMADASLVEVCMAAMQGKEWNGVTVTLEKGSQANLTPAKTTVAAKATVKKAIVAPAKLKEAKRNQPKKEIQPPSDKRPPKGEEKPRERIRQPTERTGTRREPIRHDTRKTIAPPKSGAVSSSRSFRGPASLGNRISRPGHLSTTFRRVETSRHLESSRRPESSSRRNEESIEVERMREELRRRENDRQLERERERLRIEREKIEREKLELQLLQERQKMAALEASMERTRSIHVEPRHEHSPRSSSARDRSSRSSRPEPRRDSSRDRMTDRSHHRPQMSSGGDRSRSRHDSRSDGYSRHDGYSRSETRHDSRQDSHTRREPRHESHGRNYDSRSETRHDSSRHDSSRHGSSSSGRHSFSTRDVPSSGVSGQHSFYGSRESYVPSSRGFDPSRTGAATTSWGQANWAGLPTDNWGVRNGGSAGDWSSAGYQSGAGASNIRIDYDKYRRQF